MGQTQNLGVRRYLSAVDDINALTDRGGMGLPDGYVPSALDRIEVHFETLHGATIDTLLATIGDRKVEPAKRIAAGHLLALRGDPRIDVLNPRMADIPACNAMVGIDESDIAAICADHEGLELKPEWLEKETPRYRIRLEAFRMAVFPVTNVEYRNFLMDTNRTGIPSSWAFGVYPRGEANHPVYSITPDDADAYCQWLSAKTGRRFRLPSECEWEYAAAGPGKLEYPWGMAFEPDNANTLESGILGASPVGAFPGGVSPFGLFDMAGNVEEYVSSNYRPYPGGRFVVDDLVMSLGPDYRIARGGAFSRFRDMARCTRRHGGPLPRQFYAMGFRLAEDP